MSLFITLMIIGTVGEITAASMVLTTWTPARDRIAMGGLVVGAVFYLAGIAWAFTLS